MPDPTPIERARAIVLKRDTPCTGECRYSDPDDHPCPTCWQIEAIEQAITDALKGQWRRHIKAICVRCALGQGPDYDAARSEWFHPIAGGPARYRCAASAIWGDR